MCDDDQIVISIAKIMKVFDGISQQAKMSVGAGSIYQRVQTDDKMLTAFELFYGRKNPKENGWTCIWGLTEEMGSIERIEITLDAARSAMHAEHFN